jgi:hypothetical protein
MFNSKLLTFDWTGSGCIRFNDIKIKEATFAEW